MDIKSINGGGGVINCYGFNNTKPILNIGSLYNIENGELYDRTTAKNMSSSITFTQLYSSNGKTPQVSHGVEEYYRMLNFGLYEGMNSVLLQEGFYLFDIALKTNNFTIGVCGPTGISESVRKDLGIFHINYLTVPSDDLTTYRLYI